MKDDQLFVGCVVSSNGCRDPGGVVYLVVGVEMGPGLFDGPTWRPIDTFAPGRWVHEFDCSARDAAEKHVGTGRWVAVAVLAVLEPTPIDNPRNKWPGPVSAVCIELWTDARFESSPVPGRFPGRGQLNRLLENHYPSHYPEVIHHDPHKTHGDEEEARPEADDAAGRQAEVGWPGGPAVPPVE